jgi:phosphate-selective porin OprO and OprP
MKTLSLTLAAAALALAVPARAEQEKPADPAPEKKNPPVSASGEGFSIQSEDGDYKLQLRGYAQLDGRFFPGDDDNLSVDQFVLRRVRPIVQGTVAKYFDFNITPDFGVGTTVLQDAYLDVHTTSKLRVRFGKFKSPVGLERLQSASVITFVERAYPTAIVPNRDVGIMIHGDLAKGVVSYAAALLDGAPDGGSVDLDTNDGKDVAGRVFVSPFKTGRSLLKDLGFGIAGTTGRQSGPLPVYRSGGQVSIVTIVQGVTADGTRNRYSPQLSFYSGPFGLLAEYAHSDSRVKKADGSHVDLEAEAWQTTASFVLTGDKASFGGVRARKPFDPAKGQWGAFEVAGRVNGIELGREAVDGGIVDGAKSVRKAFAWALGLNWWLNRNLRALFDYERTTFTAGAAGRGREPENAVFIRTQVSF